MRKKKREKEKDLTALRVSVEVWVRSPAAHSGLKIQGCHAYVLDSTPGQEPPFAVGMTITNKKEKSIISTLETKTKTQSWDLNNNLEVTHFPLMQDSP